MRLRFLSALLGGCISCFVYAVPPLPVPASNNAVARLEREHDAVWISALGIGPGKTWRDLKADGYWLRDGDNAWRRLPPVPDGEGRLAAQAVAAGGALWLIGGYTVAEDGAEHSTPEVWRVTPWARPVYRPVAPMPVPVDDAVALVYGDRYIYLISGWHDTGNVNLVQVYDTREDSWTQAEPWPGAPVFGHAGGIVDDELVICGGAKVEYPQDGPRRFVSSPDCWYGRIRPDDHRRIGWLPVSSLPGPARYRAAAVGTHLDGIRRIVFAGGTDNPYNYDGVGYDGRPAEPLDAVVSFNLDERRWECHDPAPTATMDHRGLITANGELVLIGGMDDERRVRRGALVFRLSPARQCGNTGDSG